MNSHTVLETSVNSFGTFLGTGFGSAALFMGLIMTVLHFTDVDKSSGGNLFFAISNCFIGVIILMLSITPEALVSCLFGLLYVVTALVGLTALYLGIGLFILRRNIQSSIKLAVLDNKFDTIIDKIETIERQLAKNKSSLFRVPKLFKKKIEKANGLLLDKKVDFLKVIEAYKNDLSESKHYR